MSLTQEFTAEHGWTSQLSLCSTLPGCKRPRLFFPTPPTSLARSSSHWNRNSSAPLLPISYDSWLTEMQGGQHSMGRWEAKHQSDSLIMSTPEGRNLVPTQWLLVVFHLRLHLSLPTFLELSILDLQRTETPPGSPKAGIWSQTHLHLIICPRSFFLSPQASPSHRFITNKRRVTASSTLTWPLSYLSSLGITAWWPGISFEALFHFNLMPEATGYIKSLVVFSKALVQPQIPRVTFKLTHWKHSLQPPVISRGQEVSKTEKQRR